MVRGAWQGEKRYAIDIANTPELHIAADGPASTDLVLAGLIACSGRTFVDILTKMRQEVKSIHLEVAADRVTERPKVFSKIYMTWTIECGDTPQEKVRRALDLTEEYCTVLNILKKAAPIELNYQLS